MSIRSSDRTSRSRVNERAAVGLMVVWAVTTVVCLAALVVAVRVFEPDVARAVAAAVAVAVAYAFLRAAITLTFIPVKRPALLGGGRRTLGIYLTEVGQAQAEILLALTYWTAVAGVALVLRVARHRLLPDTFKAEGSHWIPRPSPSDRPDWIRRQY